MACRGPTCDQRSPTHLQMRRTHREPVVGAVVVLDVLAHVVGLLLDLSAVVQLAALEGRAIGPGRREQCAGLRCRSWSSDQRGQRNRAPHAGAGGAGAGAGASHGPAPRTTPHPPPSDAACLGRRCRWLLRTPPAARGPLQVKASPTTLAPSIRRDGEVFDEMLRGLRFLLRLCAWGNNRDMIFVDRDLLLVENYSNSRGRAFLGSLPQYLEAGQTAHSNTNPSNSSFVICLSRLSSSANTLRCTAEPRPADPIRPPQHQKVRQAG